MVPAAAEGGATSSASTAVRGEAPRRRLRGSLATGLHQVDSPAFDGLGRLYVTHSGGARHEGAGADLSASARDGMREPVAVEIANPTSLALGPDGAMYVSSRFEGTCLPADARRSRSRSTRPNSALPTGLAFARDGALFVGDRSGSYSAR